VDRPRRFSPQEPAPPTGAPRPYALRLLARRDHTVHELRCRLLDRGYSEEAVGSVIAEFRAEGLLDDSRVAAAHVRTASSVKGRGRHRIRRELEARGVDAAIAEQATALLGGDDEAAAIERLIDRKTHGRPLEPNDRRRLFQHLLRRGFSADAIGKALRVRP
jgi:regulatory protein